MLRIERHAVIPAVPVAPLKPPHASRDQPLRFPRSHATNDDLRVPIVPAYPTENREVTGPGSALISETPHRPGTSVRGFASGVGSADGELARWQHDPCGSVGLW